ncbi:MAG: ATP-binding protein [Desulfitobacteriaceae bacterium]|jgi:ATP-dependent DNA helicase RecG|nr:ATP-binding protein [Clostridia bacterium]MDD4402234.1 ATP-binding protein [Desulfitobacteriaceae bacterium]
MTDYLLETLNLLIERDENELVEFKEANNDYDKNKIGQYFSAISNEANLKEQQYGWLIFGVRNRDKKIIGSNYRDTVGLDRLKHEISVGTTGNISFIDIFEVYPIIEEEARRVVMFKIPAAVTAIPTGWNNHYYAREGESLVPLSMEKLERIRRQHRKDWSKQIIEKGTIEHLDKEALLLARQNYKDKIKKSHIIQEIDAMSDKAFLTKLRLISEGKLTNAAMVLLGNSDYCHLIDRPPTVMWRLYSGKGEDRDYEIFEIPFITVGDRIYNKIRNLTYRYMPNQKTLFPMETQQYDQSLFYELLNNCIAHQDYSLGARIYVNEFEDKIKFTNPGSFMPRDIRTVLDPSYAPPFYRNQLLAETMAKLFMIDTASMGIRKVFNILREKYFPMPDYDITANQVSVTVYGKILDLNYTRLLFDNPDFDINTVFLLDQVQKGKKISGEESRYLRKMRLIEGKMPGIYLSSSVATMIDEKEQYIRNRAFDDKYYKDLIIGYLNEFGKAKKKDIMKLLFIKLPDALNEKQKEYKVRNLLSSMKAVGIIETDSDNNRLANWVLVKKD